MANNGKPRGVAATLQEIPNEQIVDAAKTFETCILRVTRRNARGQLQTVVNGVVKPVMDLIEIDAWLNELGGGGDYRVEPRNPHGVEPLFVVPPFAVRIEGPPKPPIPDHLITQPGPMGFVMGPQGPVSSPPSPQPQMGGWVAGLHPQHQAAYNGAQQQMSYPGYPPGYPYPFFPPQNSGPGPARYQSDALALQQVADLKGELAKFREEAKAERDKREDERRRSEERERERERAHEAELLRLREAHAQQLERQREKEAVEERRRQDERFQQLQLQAQQRPSLREELAPILDALKKPERDRELELQIKMMEMQSSSNLQLMNALMQAGKGDKEMFALLKDMMEQRGPETQAALLNTMLEMQITSAGAIANLVKETMPEAPPIWMQALANGLDQVKDMAENYIEAVRSQPAKQPSQPQPQRIGAGGPAPRALPLVTVEPMEAPPDEPPLVRLAGVPSRSPFVTPAPTAPPASTQAPSEEEVVSAMSVSDESERRARVAAELDKFAMFLPEEFRTIEWRAILIELHAQAPVERVAHLFARHIGNLIEFRGLPKPLLRLREDPQGTLRRMAGYFPIAQQAPDYLSQAIDTTVRFLSEDGYLDNPDKDADAQEPASVPVVDAPDGPIVVPDESVQFEAPPPL